MPNLYFLILAKIVNHSKKWIINRFLSEKFDFHRKKNARYVCVIEEILFVGGE